MAFGFLCYVTGRDGLGGISQPKQVMLATCSRSRGTLPRNLALFRAVSIAQTDPLGRKVGAQLDAELQRSSFYRRVLPHELVSFSSREGKSRLIEAAAEGAAEAYFPLAEQFITQLEPAFCGPSCLAMVLNTLQIDPNTTWKGGWRWFDEHTLARGCCKPLADIETDGITLDEFAALGRCNGALVDVFRPAQSAAGSSNASGHTAETNFRRDIISTCSMQGSPYLVVSFLRTALGQTGTGHFSPIAAYHVR